MTEKKVLKAEGVGELVGAVTALLGYMPSQSLVIAPLAGTRATSAMRVDLPTDAEVYPAMVAQVMGLTCRVQGVTGFAAVIYTDGTDSEHEGLAATLLSAASFIGLDVATVAFVTPTTWGEYFEGAARPLDTLPALPGPDLVRDGDQTSGASLPVVDEALRVRIFNAPLPHPESVDACALFEDVLTWNVEALDAEKVAVLTGLVSLPIFRDVALAQWATTEGQGRETLAAQKAFLNGAPIADEVGGVILGQGSRPEVTRLQGALAVCRIAAAHAPTEESAAALLTACGWLSWALGSSTHASFYIDLARAADPTLSMADLMAELVAQGMLPEWVFTR
ncbi:DUF4192 family protein [Microbacterium sp. YY-02]|uniref:DUF4192 family protein n=1 Tax=Microbacterium sp. YY-02 TaxID=3421635 RepID=UPI003D167C52